MKRFFKRLFLKNWGLKLFSFLLALILWLTLITPEKIFSDKWLTIPLELHNIPPEMELMEKPPASVDVKIRASKSLINDITSANVHAVLNLEKASIDQEDYPLRKSMISIPSGAEVREIRQSQVSLKLERTREILLDVEANIIGELKKGLKVENVGVFPPQVLIKGPESKVKDNYKVRTSPIDISSFTETTELEADLILPNPDLRLASTQTKVRVRILIQEENPEAKRGKKKTQKK
ncbi:MAG: YbbR-like domain-containing protein [Candidatus Aminicenantes bacterium]|jgi:YbbR domain-containing protein|nr:YbbR-like domain-containing protein [Candidatus Aminicenantes bacterium]